MKTLGKILIGLCLVLFICSFIAVVYSPVPTPDPSWESQLVEVVVDEHDGTPNNFGYVNIFYFSSSGDRGMHGQCFNVSGGDFYISRANFTLYNYSGNPFTTMYVALYVMNVTEPNTFGSDAIPNLPWGNGEELANSVGIYQEITGEIEITFEFNTSNQFKMMEGTVYGVGIWASGGTLSSGNAIGLRGMRGEGETHEGNAFQQYSSIFDDVSSMDYMFAVYGYTAETYEYEPRTFPSIWVSVGSPFMYQAIAIWSLAFLIGEIAVLATFKTEALPVAVLYGVGITIVLFISLAIMSAFSGI